MPRAASLVVCRPLTLLLLLLAASCTDDPVAPEGYSKVTPASIPGAKVEVLEPLQLTDKARIPENDPAYKSVEVFKDRLVLHYSSAPTITLAAGHVVAGGDKIGYLRKIISVTQQGATTLELRTQNAYLGELIYKGHFRVTQEPLAKDFENAGGDINKRCYPLGLGEQNFSIFKDFDVGACKVGAGGTLNVEPDLIITPKLVFEVDFDPGWLLIDGELVYAKFAFEGTVEASAKLTGTGLVSAKCEMDIIKELRTRTKNDQLFKIWLPTIKFAVGPVPVVITHYFEPIAKSTLEAKLEVESLTAMGKVKLGVKAGTEYSKKDNSWSAIWEPSRSGSVEWKTGQNKFKATVSDELAFGLGYTALLYSTAGPKLGLSLGATLSGSASPDTCKWDAKLELGVNFDYGAELQIPVLDKKIWDATGKVALYKKELVRVDGDIPSCQADAGVEAGSDAGLDLGADAPTPDQALADQALADQAQTDQGATDQGATDQSSTDQGVTDQGATDLGPVTDAGPPSCTNGAPVFLYGPNMITCPIKANTNQCAAAALCPGGWHLCTATEFLARGGKTTSPTGTGWLSSCIRNGGAFGAPTNTPCSCITATGTKANGRFDCSGGSPYGQTGLYVGVRSNINCYRIGLNSPSTQGYWLWSPANYSGSTGAVCCN